MVYGICRAMLRDPHDAEDATQQAFLSAYRSLLGGAQVRDEGAWLATIARNECRARIASGMRRPLPVADEDLAAIPASGDEAERRAQAEALRAALGELPERQREAVVLRHLYGLSYGEVGRALGLSRPATEALLFRARRSMRLRLRPVVATAIAVPVSVQEGLAQAIPGFSSAGAGALVGGAAGGGLLAKLASAPVAAKVATAAVAVTTVGAVGSIESERAGRDRAEHGGLVTTVDRGPGDGDSTGTGGGSGSAVSDSRGSGSDDEPSGDDDSGPGSGTSGPGSASSGSADDGRELDDNGGSSGKGSGDGSSSGDDSDDHSGSGSGDDSDDSDDSDDEGSSDSSGSGSSGSDDGPSDDSSGSGDGSSDDGSGGDDSANDSSGSGSGDDADFDSSGSGDSASGDDGSGGGDSSGGGDDDEEPDD